MTVSQFKIFLMKFEFYETFIYGEESKRDDDCAKTHQDSNNSQNFLYVNFVILLN